METISKILRRKTSFLRDFRHFLWNGLHFFAGLQGCRRESGFLGAKACIFAIEAQDSPIFAVLAEFLWFLQCFLEVSAVFLEVLADQKLIFEVLVSQKITLSVRILVRAADQNAIFRNLVSQIICKRATASLKQGFC